MNRLFLIFFLLIPFLDGHAQNESVLKDSVRSAWQHFKLTEGESVKCVLELRKQLEGYIRKSGGDRAVLLENGAFALRHIAGMYRDGKDAGLRPSILKKVLKGVDLKSEAIVSCTDMRAVTDDYYALKFIMEGVPVEMAWGGMWFNTSLPTVGNEYDYRKYREIFELENDALSLAYFTSLPKVFRYNGYTRDMDRLRPWVEKYLPEGKIKEEIRRSYEAYAHLQPGKPAPDFSLKDFRGKVHNLEEFRGKVLVVDVWATWCGGCLQKLPLFMKMKEKFAGRKDIEFITISIDDQGMFQRWKYTLPRMKLLGVKNLIASKEVSDFQGKYMITGIPRYFIIDREGKIVNVHVPAPGPVFEAMIEEVLKNE